MASKPGIGNRETGGGSLPLLMLLVTLVAGCGGDAPGLRQTFTAAGDVEVVATVSVSCAGCDWAAAGREAVVLAVTLDARPPVHLPVVRGGESEHRLMLGAVSAGRHTVMVAEEPSLTAAQLRGKNAARVTVAVVQIPAAAAHHQAISLAPIVYARPDTVGRFTDVPLLMWYEIEPTARGQRYRYSVIFSNEDGGTPTDRLMATWGRTTDIEYLYSVEVDAAGAILDDDMQGPKHEILPFRGTRDGRHPLLWVSTENNMVLDSGTTTVRYAPAPELVDLTGRSREQVMDANPWTYAVMAHELAREGKIVADAPPGQDTIPDPRRFVFVEGCGTAGDNAISVGVRVNGEWLSSDRGVAEYRVARDGCFRAAIPLPGAATASDVTAVRVQAFPRQDKPAATLSQVTRLNTLFSLDERFAPGPRLFQWTGAAVLHPGGDPFEIAVR